VRLLLYLYPAGFRAEYGDEMLAIFEQRKRQRGAIGIFFLWIETLFEVLWNSALVNADILRQDLRYGLCTLSRSPGFALAAITVSALGIGATTAAFTMVDHVLIRPLDFKQPEKLVKLYEDHSFASGSIGRNWNVSPANFRDWKRMATSFESMGAYRNQTVNLVGIGEPEQLDGASFTADMLPTLGVNPVIGRIFTPDDDREDSPGTVLLSYGLWQRAFGGDASVLGRKVLLDQVPYTVIGVMPKQFIFPDRGAQFWTAMRFAPQDYSDRANLYLYGIARLRPGFSLEQAQAEMQTVAGQMERSYPKDLAHVGTTVLQLRSDLGQQSRMMLWVLLAAAACVLLISSMNLAGLMMARAMRRKRELAVRTAIGGGRERLVRQMLTESVLLAVTGGALGIVIAFSALPLLVRLVPVSLPVAEVPSVDWRVLLFTLTLTLGTGLLFGLAPALRVSRNVAGLRDTSRAGGGRTERLRSLLVVAEVTGCVVLLICCGLLLRALARIQGIDPGFRAENVITMRTPLPMPKYEQLPFEKQFYDKILAGAKSLPGVTSAAYISFLPMVMRGGIWPVEVEGHPLPVPERQTASLRFITPGLFESLGIPLKVGRDVTATDNAKALPVAVVSEAFVRRYWPNENPLGRRFDFANGPRTIVGVVGDIKVRGLERTSEPQVYLPYEQLTAVSSWYAPKDLVVRATGNVEALAPALRRIVREADSELPVSDVRLLTEIVEAETGPRRVQLFALGSFALIAFILASVGIHGLLAFAVASRTQEIGVRMALGATAGTILKMIVGGGAVLAGIGVALGIVLGYGAGRGLEALLAGVRPTDITTFAGAVALCLVMTLAGCILPARRAVKIDPATAVRSD
jgi:predicted permease